MWLASTLLSDRQRLLLREYISMATYLVTGGCGFIGSHLVDNLLEQGHSVRVLDNLSTGQRQNLSSDADLIVGDIADTALVRSAMDKVSGCFHLAAVAPSHETAEDWFGSHRVNLAGTINILDAARLRSTPIIYASSAAVYGDNADVPLREHASVRPLSAYGADKLGSEMHARVASLVHGVPTVGLRLFNVYGPRQNPLSPYSGVISQFVKQITEDGMITIHGDGEQTRDFVYVDDVVRFLQKAMDKAVSQPAVFNVCTGSPTRVKHLAQMLISIVGSRVPVRYTGLRCGDIRSSVGDPTRSRNVLESRAETPLAEGLRQLVAFRSSPPYRTWVNLA
jgi:UDP-glucose 4-epimerase